MANTQPVGCPEFLGSWPSEYYYLRSGDAVGKLSTAENILTAPHITDKILVRAIRR